MRDIVNEFMIGPSAAQVGVVRYSSTAAIVINFDSSRSKIDLLNAITSLPTTTGGSTNTAQGIQLGTQLLTGAAARSNANKVLFVVTDGRSDNSGATTARANEARAANIELFAVGIGAGVNVDELSNIASDPDATHRFQAEDFSEEALSRIARRLSTMVCPRGK